MCGDERNGMFKFAPHAMCFSCDSLQLLCEAAYRAWSEYVHVKLQDTTGVVPANADLPHPCALHDVLQVMLCGPNRVPIQVVRREVGTPLPHRL